MWIIFNFDLKQVYHPKGILGLVLKLNWQSKYFRIYIREYGSRVHGKRDRAKYGGNNMLTVNITADNCLLLAA